MSNSRYLSDQDKQKVRAGFIILMDALKHAQVPFNMSQMQRVSEAWDVIKSPADVSLNFQPKVEGGNIIVPRGMGQTSL